MTRELVCVRRVPSSRRRWAVLAGTVTLIVLGWATASGRYGGANSAVAEDPKFGPEAAGQMVVAGRVLGADGRPVAGCQVALLTRHFRRSEKPDGTWPLGHHPGFSRANRVSATGQTDGEGRFRLTGPGAYSPALPTQAAAVIASAPGHGLAAHQLDHALGRQEVIVKLPPERVVRGRLLDHEGKPAAGVEVRVHVPPYPEVRPEHPTQTESMLMIVLGRQLCYTPPEGPFWPKPAVTDEQGHFLVRGLGPGKATLEARGGRIAPNRFAVETVAPEGKEEATLKLRSAPLVEGRVTEEDSGKPVAGARLLVATERGRTIVETQTDKEGRYAVCPFPGKSFELIAHPPDGSPCLVIRKENTMADARRQELNLTLPVGVALRGRVVEVGSGKPVAGARVQYRQRNADNPLLRKGSALLPHVNTLFLEEGDSRPVSTLETAISDKDGRFQLGVAPGPGHLFVLGPTLDYVPVEITLRELEGGKPGAFRYYPHAVVPLDLKPGAEAPEVKAELRRGVTLRGRVVGPDGKPAKKFIVLCRSYIPSGWHQWNVPLNWLEGRDGTFELPGCDPDKAVTAHFWDRENGLGATADLSAKQGDGQQTTIRLEPCGKAEVLCVDLDGKPLVDYRSWSICFQFDPGAHEPPNLYCADRPLEGNWFVFGGGPPPDKEGKATLTNLIPGATYHVHSHTGTGGLRDWKPHTLSSFTVKSGQTSQVRLVEAVPKATPYVNLQPKANQKLRESFHKPPDGNNLEELWRVGGGGIFSIREGLIRLASKNLKDDLPEKVEGIKVDAKFATLHILHGTVFSAPDDTVIAKYVVHYDDKSAETIEVVYGKDVRDWWRRDGDKEPTRGKVAWKGSNEAAGRNGCSIWLFTLTWKNPHPDKRVVSIDCVSTLTGAAPFVVAMTHDGMNKDR